MDSAVLAFIGFVVLGCCCLIAGVAFLFGAGWALICGGWCCLSAAVFLKRGIGE